LALETARLAIVADAANVPAEPLFELVVDELLRRPSDR
jgi:hypothetical protein